MVIDLARGYALLRFAVLLSICAPPASAQRPPFGSMTAVGSAELRGLGVFGDATVFEGDRISTGEESYVRIQLTQGPQLELGSESVVQIDRNETGFRVRMTGGRLAVSTPRTSAPLIVEVGSVKVAAPAGAAAEIVWLEPARVRVLALRERVRVVQEGEGQGEAAEEDEVIINLDAGVESAGETPPQTSEVGSGGSATAWVLVAAGAGGTAGTVIFLAGGEKAPASPTAP